MTAAMKPSAPADRWGASVSTRRRLVVSVTAGVAAGVLVGVFSDWHYGLLAGWIVAAGALVSWTWLTIWPMDPRDTARHVGREDPGRATLDVMVLLAAIASLGAVAALLVAKTKSPSIDAALSVASVAMAWGTVHTVFTARYAALYYAGHPAGSTSMKNCDTRSHVASELADRRFGLCRMRSSGLVFVGLAPPLTCVAGNGGVRSSRGSRRIPVPSGGYGQGADRTGESREPPLMSRYA